MGAAASLTLTDHAHVAAAVVSRQRGLGRAVVAHLTRELHAAAAADASAALTIFAHVVDDNAAGIATFAALGWERVCDSSWIGFKPAAAQRA